MSSIIYCTCTVLVQFFLSNFCDAVLTSWMMRTCARVVNYTVAVRTVLWYQGGSALLSIKQLGGGLEPRIPV